MNVLLGELTACQDVILWAIDLKRGMELQPWASCIDRLATTPQEAEALLGDAVVILDGRADDLTRRSARVWEPSPERPALIIVVDEYAELASEAPRAIDYADSIASRGRAPAVNLIAATQRPSKDAMGKSAVRSQMDVRLCFRVREPRDGDLVLGQGMVKTGGLKVWHPVTEAGFKHKRFAIYVWRADRVGGDTKTRKSRRTLELPKLAAEALRQHHTRQAAHKLKAGEAWQDHNLVFCTNVGTPLDAANVRRAFRNITKNAGIGTDWTPRELRHSFVSIMSDQGVPIETIADLVGHAGTSVTEAVYRHQLKPVITKGAHTMNTIFGDKPTG
ncbi:tyrosine-type recombinase/integrase [Nonomuraea sp. NPDC050643]|uniref:tyrosine-type recombinase/integrase n=1 Tax=Nonomuraea sp. NPDC050643 TaxID=3155660 RepID=UPI0033C0D6E5